MSDKCSMILAARGDDLGRSLVREVSEALAARFPNEIDLTSLAAEDPDAIVMRGRADVAVHGAEHVAADLPPGFTLAALLPRRSFTDALVSDLTLPDLPKGGRVATSNLRRRAMLLRARPDLKVVETHVDVRARIQAWRVGEVDGLVLPTYALRRLAVESPHEELDPGTFVPSAGQGALGCVCAPGSRFLEFLEEIDDARTRAEVEVERAIVRALRGGPDDPVGVHASWKGERITVDAIVLSLDGRAAVSLKETIPVGDTAYATDDLADRLRRMGGDVLLERAHQALG
ncbi:MAG TPA: hypothetical protein VGR51_05015 [Thermoplasmata archaeon]|nr:hypothetical protein [Thermoplasmata archaeon]